jgi:hypothetical protein
VQSAFASAAQASSLDGELELEQLAAINTTQANDFEPRMTTSAHQRAAHDRMDEAAAQSSRPIVSIDRGGSHL